MQLWPGSCPVRGWLARSELRSVRGTYHTGGSPSTSTLVSLPFPLSLADADELMRPALSSLSSSSLTSSYELRPSPYAREDDDPADGWENEDRIERKNRVRERVMGLQSKTRPR